MKCSAFVIFTLVIIFVPKYESLRLLKKIKDILHPTTTTPSAPVVPDYEREEERVGTSTATWEGKGQDVWETTTSRTKISKSFTDRTPQRGTENISHISTTTKPSDIFVNVNKDDSSTSVSPTNDGAASPETPGIITIPTIDNIYNNNYQPRNTTAYDGTNKNGAPTTNPTIITDNNHNKFQPDPLRPGSNPAGTQGTPTTQPQINHNRQNADDIVFPDQPSIFATTQPGTVSTERPSGPVPVREEDTRRVINAPLKDCGKGQKPDDKGKCRKAARK